MDFTPLTDAELAQARIDLFAEIDRRQRLAATPQMIADLNSDYLDAAGRGDGAEWVQPAGAYDAYPVDWTVTHNGITWRSLVPANVWEPGDPTDPQSYRWWEDVSTPPPADTEWDGNGHAYAVGEVVTYQGVTYTCLQAHTSQPGWTPAAVPALWQPA